MIRITHREIPVPGIIESLEFKNFIRQMLNDREYKEHKDYHKLLSEQLNEFHNKCAYCETPVNRAGFYLTIDHYRPKGKFTDEYKHPGYYWLGYEWTNLLLACPKCNSRKSTRFPIEGSRVFEPPVSNGNLDWNCCKSDSQVHLDEKPLLLHPVIDNPEEHFIFHGDGTIEGLTERGNVTINILGLNREMLSLERKKLLDDFYREIKKIIDEYIINIDRDSLNKNEHLGSWQLADIFEKIKKSGEPTAPYSRMGFFLFYRFEEFISDRLKKEIGEKAGTFVEKAFKEFLETYST